MLRKLLGRKFKQSILLQLKFTTKPRSHLRFHSTQELYFNSDMKIKILPALDDNYMYLLIDEDTKCAAAVDPVEPEKVLAAAKEENVSISKVLTTHHHWDHAGGNDKLAKLVSGLDFFGGDDRIQQLNKKVEHNNEFKIGSLNVKCLYTPCHTSGHICYYVTGENADPAVFTGDTLFVGGCGKFFEGTGAQMHHALIEVLGNLPLNTRVFCGHEYTVSNLLFAESVEPSNKDVIDKLKWAKNQRANKLITIPSTIGDEFKYNPFMRVREEVILQHCKSSTPQEAMGSLRNEKNNFRPKM